VLFITVCTFVTSSTLSKPVAKTATLSLFEIIIPFAHELEKIKPSPPIQTAIKQLIREKIKIQNNTVLNPSVLDTEFAYFVKQIINFRSSISSNLQQFWDAQIDMMDISDKKNKPYNPAKYAMENKKTILVVNSRYEKAAIKFSKNLDNEVLLYSLFYAHILRIETIEYSFLADFKDSLKNFGLLKKYDAEKIFSVKRKVKKGWIIDKKTKKMKKAWRTDGRAIRDCLGHNAYDLDFSKDPWKIKFKSTKKGYEYNKSFNRDSFVSFMNNTDLLYRSSLMMLFTIFTLTLCKQHFSK